MRRRQFTVRGVPESLDRELRKQARTQRKSLNRVLLEALEKGVDIGAEVTRYHDLDDLAGTWVEAVNTSTSCPNCGAFEEGDTT